MEERCWLYPLLSGHGSWLEHVTLSNSSFPFFCLIAFFLSQPQHLSQVCNIDSATKWLEFDGLGYMVVISEDFGGNQSYADTYRYFPSSLE